MKFFTPYLHLIRRHIIDGDDLYFLQVIIYCDQFNYAIDPEYTTNFDPSDPSVFHVHLTILQDENLPSNHLITPLTHRLNLGALSAQGDVSIQVNLYVQKTGVENNGNQPVATVNGSTIDADEETRPVVPGV